MPFASGQPASARRNTVRRYNLTLARDRSLALAIEAEKHGHFEIAERLFSKAYGFDLDLASLRKPSE